MTVANDPPQVLLALSERECALSCLKRAADLTIALGAELQVLRVLPASPWPLRVFRRRAARAHEEARAALRATRRWLAHTLGEEPPAGKVVVRRGTFVDQVVGHALARHIELIVIPPYWWSAGTLATTLARRSGVKVFVAHEPGHHKSILAATDLSSDGFPVLKEAARLALALHAPVTALHNVDPLSVMAGGTTGFGRGTATALTGVRRQMRLADVVRQLPVETIPIVRVEIDPVSAILEEARHHDIDIVVVGVYERSRVERFLHGSVAARIVQKTQRSVLVTPIS